MKKTPVKMPLKLPIKKMAMQKPALSLDSQVPAPMMHKSKVKSAAQKAFGGRFSK